MRSVRIVRVIGSALAFPELNPGRTIVALGAAILVAYISAAIAFERPDGRIIRGDAVHQYVYLRSIVFDRDLHFQNDYAAIYTLKGGRENTPPGALAFATDVQNVWPVGSAILWAPLFLLVTAGVALSHLVGGTYPLDGYGPIFQISAGVTGVLAATLAAWMSYCLCARFSTERAAIWAVLAVWLGSSAIYYSMVSPTYSHAASMLVTSAFFWYWATTLGRQTWKRYAVLGLLAGCCALVRWQDAVLLIVPVLDAVRAVLLALPSRRWGPALGHVAVCGAAALLTFTPQMLAWFVLYGTPLTIPQGPGFMRWTSPQMVAVLFSDQHGLFSWTPIAAIAVAGFILLFRRHRTVALGAIVIFAVSVYVNAAVWDWWAGEAFGARRFVSCFPVFTLGLSAIFERMEPHRIRTIGVTSIVVGLNGLLLLQYQAFMHGLRAIAPYPSGFYGLVIARFVVPIDLVKWLWAR